MVRVIVVTGVNKVVGTTVVVMGCGPVVNIEAVHGPVAVMTPVELMVIALTSHQYTVLYCKVSWFGSALVMVLSE